MCLCTVASWKHRATGKRGKDKEMTGNCNEWMNKENTPILCD
jgi:hypothetical protein